MRCCDAFGLTPVQYTWALLRCTPWLALALVVGLVVLVLRSVLAIVDGPVDVYHAWAECRARDRAIS
jgi:flagellar biosynthesis protein FliQ